MNPYFNFVRSSFRKSSARWAAATTLIALLGAGLAQAVSTVPYPTGPSSVATNPANVLMAKGHFQGNGGDYVRATFMKVGDVVLQYLTDTTEGQALVINNNLDINALAATLSINGITVVEQVLKDNSGADVDAIGTPGMITLDKEVWMDHFDKQRDIYYLVFHEMLRSVGFDDDNYVVSAALNPFPLSRQIVTRIDSILPLVDGDLLESFVQTSQIVISGSGCSQTELGEQADFDPERNILDISFQNFTMVAGQAQGKSLDRKVCMLAIPIYAQPGRRLIVSQLDVGGTVNLSPNSSAQIQADAFMAGTTAPLSPKKIVAAGPTQPLQGRILLRRSDVAQTPCGGAGILRLNTSAYDTNTTAQNSILDISRMTLYFRVESCTQ